ncbi:photosynthetic complex putative assembly protein PuhB [Rhodobium gokarnense]|uniref:YdbS-like PH domain-containing protein n=1 Tax=Rhodobium gokarnense TaxID=364296 RepID=A0ABT3HBK1_9HYPH|nr:photosynthetic complex putative assembly protein PuhB [Rhodobium gokarnense]MCW2307782.1 hypothetical protein [Rhodobium gokarnense]
MMFDQVREHEYEPVEGLPEKLPEGEFMLWQGRPDGRSIARRVMKTGWFAFYFLVLAAWAFTAGLYDGRGLGASTFSAGALVLFAAVLIGLLEAYAWGVHRTTMYTVTNRRVVMRVGVALPFTLNLPFSKIASADLATGKRGIGDIAMALRADERVSWLMMWPHVRPWRMFRCEPALRCIPEAEKVAGILGKALSDYLAGHADEAPRIAVTTAGPETSRQRTAGLKTVTAAE